MGLSQVTEAEIIQEDFSRMRMLILRTEIDKLCHPDRASGLDMIYFDKGDRENPYNWGLVSTDLVHFSINKLFNKIPRPNYHCHRVNPEQHSSAITSNAITYIMDDFFNIKGDIQCFLPTTVYIIRYILGPLVFRPLSESVGRKIVTF
jgi:hypothetical protein